MSVDNTILDNVNEYIYLVHVIKTNKEKQTAEVRRRVLLTWATFGKLKHIPMWKVFNIYIYIKLMQ